MDKLTKTEVKEFHQTVELPTGKPGETNEVVVASLDPSRNWAKVMCPHDHENVVEAHEGGSRAECSTCGMMFDYGGYDHASVTEVSASDSGRVADKG